MANDDQPAVMIRYRLRPDQIEPNLELLGAVYAELESRPLDGLGWTTFQLEDGVSFVDFVRPGGPPGALSQRDAFRRYRSTLDERCDEPPVLMSLREVGSVGFPSPAAPTGPTGPLRVAIIAGSTRPGRKADAVAAWVHGIAADRDDATFEVVDIADHALPLLDESMPPMAGRYEHAHTRAWAATIDAFDAYVFVTPEYNHSTSAALKNAIDFLFAEWNDKAAGFVAYGAAGGTRAVKHLRLILAELKVAGVRSDVTLSLDTDWQDYTDPSSFTPHKDHADSLAAMLDELVAWSTALKTVRTHARA